MNARRFQLRTLLFILLITLNGHVKHRKMSAPHWMGFFFFFTRRLSKKTHNKATTKCFYVLTFSVSLNSLKFIADCTLPMIINFTKNSLRIYANSRKFIVVSRRWQNKWLELLFLFLLITKRQKDEKKNNLLHWWCFSVSSGYNLVFNEMKSNDRNRKRNYLHEK